LNGALRFLVAIVLVLFATLFVLNAFESERPWINHDVGYHTYLGKEMARGAALYVDLKEDNPPGNPILLGLIAVLAETLSVPDFIATHLFVLLLGAVGLFVLRRSFEQPQESLAAFLTTCAYLLVIIRPGYSNNLYADAIWLPYDFGQREQLFVLLFLPYLARRLARRGGERSAFLGWVVLLGFVSTFKPFWGPMVLVVEGFRLIQVRRIEWRPLLCLAFGAVLPILLLALHSPVSAQRFLFENIPMYLRGGYDHYATPFADFAMSALHLQIVAGFLLLALLAGAATIRGWLPRRDSLLLLATAAMSYFALWHQHKFWSYHALPIFGITLFAIAYLIGSWRAPVALKRPAIPLLALLVTALVSLSTLFSAATMLQRYPPLGAFLVPAAERYERTMYFSMSVMVQYPPLLLDRPMLGPWTVLLDLPELIALPEEAERERSLSTYFGEVRDEIQLQRPQLLIFSPQAQALPAGVTLHQLFERYDGIPPGEFREVTAQALGVTSPLARGWRFYVSVNPR
jgi:hypothetical protein